MSEFTLTPGSIEAEFAAAERFTVDKFYFSLVPHFDEALFRRFLSGKLVASGDNALIHGGPGTGKTFLVYCLARACAQQGKTVRMLNEGEWDHDGLREPLNFSGLSKDGQFGYDRGVRRLRDDLIHCDLLVVNEFGRSSRLDDGRLPELIKARYAARRSTVIVTTHHPYKIIANNMLSQPDHQRRVEDTGMDLYNPYSTGRLFLDLNIGVVTRCSRSLQAIADRMRVPDDRFAQDIYNLLWLTRLSWTSPADREELLRVTNPLREWQLFYLGDQSFRRTPEWAIEQATKAKDKAA